MALKLHLSDSAYQNAGDADLMLAYQGGDARAFDILLKRHQAGVFNFLYRQLGGMNAEEAFQEVFERLIKARSGYAPTAKFTTWLYTIARNYCVDQARKNRLRKTISIDEGWKDEDGTSLNEVLSSPERDPDQELRLSELQRRLDSALSTLNADQREVFLLREKNQLSFGEIAAIVGSSESTVKSRMRYALQALRQSLKKYGFKDLSSS